MESLSKQELYNLLKTIADDNKQMLNYVMKKYNCGTVPNRKMTIVQMREYYWIFVQSLKEVHKQQSQILMESEPFECSICLETKQDGLSRCIETSHKICDDCVQIQDDEIEKGQSEMEWFCDQICPICRQNRMDQLSVYCYIDDRKNINREHLKRIIQRLDINKLKTAKYRYKWLLFELVGTRLYVVTDRYKQVAQKNNEYVEIYLD